MAVMRVEPKSVTENFVTGAVAVSRAAQSSVIRVYVGVSLSEPVVPL